jgi:hypothetical protein
MADVQVTCINKPNRNSLHEHITYLGNSTGKWPRAQVISWIENGANTFFTLERGKRANIVVRQGPTGKYVQTQADGQWTNNLLALSECP